MTLQVRNVLEEERRALARLLTERWGSAQIVSRDRVHDASGAEALVAVRDEREIVGAATFVVHDREVELLTLDAIVEREGVGSALVDAVARAGALAGAHRLVLTTTNDNLGALGFYQRRGFELEELRAGAVARARTRKPQIPLVGSSGIPIRDELVLVRNLEG